MNSSPAAAALLSWNINWGVVALLIATALVYVRGWRIGRTLIRDERDFTRLNFFLSGLALIFLANESPLDAFDNLFLAAHMAQHLLLMMLAPPLILLAHPVLPLLRGLPKRFVKEGLGPFLTWPLLRKIASVLTFPPVAWLAFAVSTIVWHMPRFYELALSSPGWHAFQHASFFWTGILFWWPVIQPGPAKPRWPRWVAIPYLLMGDFVNTGLSAYLIFCGRILYPSYNVTHAAGMPPQEDQTLAGAIMWVPGEIIYLIPAVIFAMSLVTETRRRRPVIMRVHRSEPRKPWRLARFRPLAQIAMLLLALVVMADGFWGKQVTPLNLAGVLPWVHWRFLTVFALLVFGNVFCMACPFTFARDLARRFLPANLRWPRALRSKWLAALLLVTYIWAYEAFSLWDSPWLTAWLIAGYFIAAIAIDGLFRGASFCKYVCPIGQFHFVSSLVSPREVSIRKAETCASCRTYDCIRGNAQTRGCELNLFQPKKAGNLDCTFCLDCVNACPHDNVSFIPVPPAKTLTIDPYRSSIGRLSKRIDWMFLALVFVFGAFVNAAGMVAPVMMLEHRLMGSHSMPLIIGAFVALGGLVIPLLLASLKQRLAFSLVPLGVGMWFAHVFYHIAVRWTTSLHWIDCIQILSLDAGLLATLYIGRRIDKKLIIWIPWAALACVLYAAGVWIYLQPMQMRGM